MLPISTRYRTTSSFHLHAYCLSFQRFMIPLKCILYFYKYHQTSSPELVKNGSKTAPHTVNTPVILHPSPLCKEPLHHALFQPSTETRYTPCLRSAGARRPKPRPCERRKRTRNQLLVVQLNVNLMPFTSAMKLDLEAVPLYTFLIGNQTPVRHDSNAGARISRCRRCRRLHVVV